MMHPYTQLEINAIAETLMRKAMIEWPTAYETLPQAIVRDVEDIIAARAVAYARLSAYLSRRYMGGNYDTAVKKQNQVAAKVRRALGFTYKDAPLTF